MTGKALTDKQRRFIEEYLIDLNATQAAIRAGYSAKTANRIAAELLTKDYIAAALQAAQDDRATRTGITADEVLADLVKIKERCMQQSPVLDRRGQPVKDNQGRSVWAFDSRGALKALELMGKHLGMFTDRHEINADDSLRVHVDYGTQANVLTLPGMQALSDNELQTLDDLLTKANGNSNLLILPDNGRDR